MSNEAGSDAVLDEEQVRMDETLAQAVRAALLQHKRAGNPVPAWIDGKVVWIPAHEIPVDDPLDDLEPPEQP